MSPLLLTLSHEPSSAEAAAAIEAARSSTVPIQYCPPPTFWLTVDLGLLALGLTLALWMVRRDRPSRWLSLLLYSSLAYFGLFRGGCLCPAGATANTALALVHPELIGRAELALFLLPLIAALAAGRLFCGALCPLGAVQALFSRENCRPLPRWLHRSLLALPLLTLGLTVYFAIAGACFFVCELDAYKPLFFAGHALGTALLAWVGGVASAASWSFAGSASAWLLLALVLACGLIIPRFFCRTLCPYGPLLGAFSLVAFWRRPLDSSRCTQCSACEKSCPVQAITIDRKTKLSSISHYQCIQCNRCSSACPKGAIHGA